MNKESQRADDIIGHNVSGLESRSMTTKTNNEWEDKFKQEFGIHFSPSELQFAIAFIEDLLSSDRQRIEKEIQLAISEEINIARQEGQPTSRLTSLFVKISKILE